MTLVIGGGIGGLSAAYYLLKQPRSNVLLAEASKSLGGWIQSVKDPKTGLMFEKGPRTIRIKGNIGANTLSLIEELGIGGKVRPVTLDHPAVKNRLIYVNDKLHYLPSSLSSIFKKVPPFSKPIIFSLWKDLFSPKGNSGDQSLYEFVDRRFGNEVANYLISPMMCGICAGDAKEISVKFLMAPLFEHEQKSRSVAIGFVKDLIAKKEKPVPEVFPGELNKRAKDEKWSIFGLDGGMSCLPQALHQDIIKNGGKILINSEITELKFETNSVKYKIGSKIDECGHVISSLPANKLSRLVQREHPLLADQLSTIPFVTVGVVNVAYKGQLLNHSAFGFLIPPSQNLPVLGVVFDSCSLPQGDWTILTVMMGGRWYDKYFQSSNQEQLVETALKYNKTILGIENEPESYHVKVMKDCIPQYVVGHYEKIQNIFDYIETKKLPLSLIGSSYKGIGVNDVILSAKSAVGKIKNTN